MAMDVLCPSGKVPYRDELDAVIALNRFSFMRRWRKRRPRQLRSKVKRTERTAYKCPSCGLFHLTSMATPQ